jgi:signal transduction histidine kinase
VTGQWLADALPRPLDAVWSIKLKLALVLLGSGLVGIAYLWLHYRWLPPLPITVITIVLVLGTAAVLAHGMTRPLREMTVAARAMARGDYTRRVRATARDEVGQLAGAFNQMAADLAAADQQRRELIANVSHELRTPITALRVMLENAVDGVTDTDVLPTALHQAERLARLVDDFLDLSRIDAGVQTLHRERFEVHPLLTEAVTEARAAAGLGRTDGSSAPRFRIEVTPAGLTVFADRARLRQVVVNLLDNAVRHGPRDGEVVVLACADGTATRLEVRDEGPGIPPELRERMFQRFSRGERSAGTGGTGLGLAIARWVVELHQGKITIVDPAAELTDPDAPRTTSGSAVRVSLPAAVRSSS